MQASTETAAKTPGHVKAGDLPTLSPHMADDQISGPSPGVAMPVLAAHTIRTGGAYAMTCDLCLQWQGLTS